MDSLPGASSAHPRKADDNLHLPPHLPPHRPHNSARAQTATGEKPDSTLLASRKRSKHADLESGASSPKRPRIDPENIEFPKMLSQYPGQFNKAEVTVFLEQVDSGGS